MQNDITVVIRHTNERTLEYCYELLKQQVSPTNLFCINETPFSKAVKRTFEIGIDSDKEWTLAIDADILISNQCLNKIVSEAENLADYFFEVQGRILDKLYGVPRSGGPHLYRTKFLKQAIKFIPEEGTSLRPESDTYESMSQLGYHYYFGKDIYGLHDYEQNYKDLYIKGFIHAKKHWRYLSHFEDYWTKNADKDDDFLAALLGFESAKKYDRTVFIDRNFFPKDLSRYLESNGLHEKDSLIFTNASFVENKIQDYLSNSELKDFENDHFRYIKRSDKK